jgi:hypothetical protein
LSGKIAAMPTIIENEFEQCFERFGFEHTPAVPLVSAQPTQHPPARCVPTPADAIAGRTATSGGG